VDAVGGAALSALAVLLVAWALGVAVSGSRIGPITPQVRNSTVLAKVNEALPTSAGQALQAFNTVVGTSFFPRYLEPFARERIAPVGPPPRRIVGDPDVVDAEASVLKIHGDNKCGRGVEGTGFLISDDRLMTNAHVVAGVSDPEVLVGDDEVDARVVYYNADLDVAVLAVDGVDRPHLRFDLTARSGDGGAVLGYPQDGPYDVQPVRIRAEQRLRSPDIYGQGKVLREVYSLRGTIRPGNSGGPMVSSAGDVTGVVFAASYTDADTGYALTATQVREAAAAGLSSTDEVGTGDCAA
jgi:S1-C subfamily serine protease